MMRAIGITGLCAVSFGVAFAAGSTTRESQRAQPMSAASAPTPVRVAGLASAPSLPGLRMTVAPRKRSSVQRTAVKLAAGLTRPTPNRRAQVVAQTPRVSAPAPTPTPAPTPSSGTSQRRAPQQTAAASGPSVTFFDEGD
jgi:hypothetical protein